MEINHEINKIIEEINSMPGMAEINKNINNAIDSFHSINNIEWAKDWAVNNALNQNTQSMISKDTTNFIGGNQEFTICELSILHQLYYHGFNENESYGTKEAKSFSEDQLNYGLDRLLELKLIEEIEIEHDAEKIVCKHRLTSPGKATWENYKDKMEATNNYSNDNQAPPSQNIINELTGEIEKLKKENEELKSRPTIINLTTGKYSIAKGKETDFVRVLYVLYKMNIFVKAEDGLYASNSRDVINEFFSKDKNVKKAIHAAFDVAYLPSIFENLKNKAIELYNDRLEKRG